MSEAIDLKSIRGGKIGETEYQGFSDNSPINIMYCDREFNIRYMNPKSTETLSSLEEHLPISMKEIIGSSIDVFHKNPAHQRKLLRSEKNLPHRTIINVGPEKLDLLVSAIYDEDKNYIGNLVTWDVVTQKLLLEQEAARVSNMMENSPINVVYCDLDFKITYINPESKKTLKTIEKLLPIPVEKILGASIDIFHKNPAHQRTLLSNPKNLPHRSIINVGPEKLDLLVTAIYDNQNTHMGSMITWDVVTEKLKQEAEVARVNSMMQNSPINVMYCDRSFNITYINPKSIETLKKIEKYLPIPVEKIMGSPIDVFHKNPAHQRRLLDNDRNLPHRTIIDVGPEKLDLLASAIYDNAGAYIGIMVTWEVVTEKLKNETDMARMQSMAENAPVNILLADLDFNLVYMNPASNRVLKSLESLLPKPVDQLVGNKIDIFHKVPSHQRKIVSNDKNLPHRAKIKLGKDTLDLFVSAMYSKSGDFIGPMVTWEVITDKLNLVQNLHEAAQQLSRSASDLNASASQMSTSAEETSVKVNEASNASTLVSRGVDTVATNTEEMQSSIKEIARNANDASTMANNTKNQAQQTNDIIKQLGDSSQQIGQVIKVISSIAQQTNLLALNATIEAARAGEAGRGFAVVANEVKELAKQTAVATEEITQKIGAIQSDTGNAVRAIGDISKSIETLNTISGAIAASVEEQLATTTEVSRVVVEANSGMQTIASNIKSVSEKAGTTKGGAAQVLEAARSLAELAEKLTLLVKSLDV